MVIALALITGTLYLLVIASFYYGWEKLKCFKPKPLIHFPKVSVIIPMRNEAQNISSLLDDLINQDYPVRNLEIIVIDDHSVDNSLQMAMLYQNLNTSILSLPDGKHGKKAALLYGIENSSGEIILTTDADCKVNFSWVRTFASYFASHKVALALGPVISSQNSYLFEKIQSLELFSLLGSTAGSATIGYPVMCNGANLAFHKKIFPEIKHLYQNHVAKSGDDIFVLLEVKKKYPGGIHFIKSKGATVYTQIASTPGSFFTQRGRWVSKSKHYRDPAIIFVALVVFTTNLLLTISLGYGVFSGNLHSFIILFFIKSLIDFPFLLKVTTFFGKKKLLTWFPLVQSIYFIYVCITVIVALVAPLGWKGRKL